MSIGYLFFRSEKKVITGSQTRVKICKTEELFWKDWLTISLADPLKQRFLFLFSFVEGLSMYSITGSYFP